MSRKGVPGTRNPQLLAQSNARQGAANSEKQLVDLTAPSKDVAEPDLMQGIQSTSTHYTHEHEANQNLVLSRVHFDFVNPGPVKNTLSVSLAECSSGTQFFNKALEAVATFGHRYGPTDIAYVEIAIPNIERPKLIPWGNQEQFNRLSNRLKGMSSRLADFLDIEVIYHINK